MKNIQYSLILALRRINHDNNLGLNIAASNPTVQAALQNIANLNCVPFLPRQNFPLLIKYALSMEIRPLANVPTLEDIKGVLHNVYHWQRERIYGADELRRMNGDQLRDKISADVQKVLAAFRDLVKAIKDLPPPVDDTAPRAEAARMHEERQSVGSTLSGAQRTQSDAEIKRVDKELLRRQRAEERAHKKEAEKRAKEQERQRAKNFGLSSAAELEIAKASEPEAIAASIELTVQWCPNCGAMPISVLLYGGRSVRLCKKCNAALIQKVNSSVLKPAPRRRQT